MNKNIAVIGCGHWGKNLIRNFSKINALYAVCDPDETLSKKFSQQFSVANLTFQEILEDSNIRGVVLAVPAPLHSEMAILAMNHDKDVFVEKPLAMNEKEASSMIDCSIKNNKKIMVGHLLQYHPVFIEMKKIIANDTIGNIQHIYSVRKSFGKVRTEEDVIWSFAPHDISMILSILNEEPHKIISDKVSILQEGIADIANIRMEFSSNISAHISVSWLNPYKEQKLLVVGDKAMVVFDDTKPWEQKLTLFHQNVKLKGNVPTLNKEDYIFIAVPESEPLENECIHFCEVVNGNKNPQTNAIEGLNVVKVLSKASNQGDN